jgi:hypothetical protein
VRSEAKESIFAGSNVTGGTQGDVVIKDNSNITFAAGESIVLGPGFSVEAGSTFHAYIKDFYCSGESQMNMMSASMHNMNAGNTSMNANDKFEVTPPLFDAKRSTANEIRITPNPSDGEFDVYIDEHNRQETKIQLYNMMGSLVYNDNVCIGQTKRISINKQPVGIYLLKITDRSGQLIIKKIFST